MILTLCIVLGVLLIALWISTIALWWQHEHGRTSALESEDVIKHWNKTARLARRSWYSGLFYTKRVATWGNKAFSKTFVAVFPKSKTMFIERDILTGISHGPTSYFLRSLSHKTEEPKRLIRRKKLSKISPEEDLSV